MGLLDDAIREHLELKRRRGADPGEVAREQLEALDSPYDPHAGGTDADDSTAPRDAEAPAALVPKRPEGHDVVLGETAELDMEAVLADEDVVDATAVEEDSLEWESPPRHSPADG